MRWRADRRRILVFWALQRLASLVSCSASEFPCSPWKIPCLANSNSLFRGAGNWVSIPRDINALDGPLPPI